ncbi:MAG: TonB-dependent receptor [Acidobacteria bacterium]|nr:TonB-dependent receptor [Acidobacteriota bacterium]
MLPGLRHQAWSNAISALVICVFGLTVPQAGAAQTNAQLSGTVVARETGRPIAGATVTIEGAGTSTTTTAIGRFELPASGSAVTLVARAPGYLELRVPGAQAQSPVIIELEPTPNYLETVQVTATKSALRVGDVAASTTVVDRETIERRGDQRLTEAVEHVPGAIITTELGVFESVLLRGMPRVGNEFTNTLLLIDGVPQTNSGNDARVVALPINDASNIEIVRGPNSALYGRTAIGGAINVLTADPTATPELKVDLTGGQFGTAKGVVAASGPISQWGGYYVSVGRERSGGYFKNKVDDDFDMGNTALFGKLKFAPNGRSFGAVTINRVSSDNSTPTNEPVINGQLLHTLDPKFERFTSFNIPGPNYHQGETRFTVNYNLQLTNWARVVETFGYRDVQLKFIDDGDFIGEPYSLAKQTVTMYPFSQQADEDVYYQEARLELTGNTGGMQHAVTLGGSYERNNGTLAADFIYTDEDLFGFPDISYVNPVIPPRSAWQHDEASRVYNLGITGLFGQYIAEPTSRVVLTLAGRYDRLDLDATRGTAAKAEDTFDAFSPKLGATYKLLGASGTGPALNAYGAYSQAFLPPRRPSALVPADVPLNLQPEDISNYEAGLKGSLLDGRLSLEASYFRMTEDGVVLNQRQGAFFRPTNAGERRFKGVETGLGWSAGRASTYVNASFYRNRFGEFVIQSAGGNTVLTGNRLVLAPDYVVNWGTSVQPVPFIDLTLDVKHVGATFGDEDNSTAIEGYTLVDAAATWRRGPLRVTLSGRNLFSEEYYFDANSESADPGPPRQILLSTSIRLR